jgi:hypothetical protein
MRKPISQIRLLSDVALFSSVCSALLVARLATVERASPSLVKEGHRPHVVYASKTPVSVPRGATARADIEGRFPGAALRAVSFKTLLVLRLLAILLRSQLPLFDAPLPMRPSSSPRSSYKPLFIEARKLCARFWWSERTDR